MSTLADILTFLVDALGGAFMVFVVLRFMLQVARADFYNPMSQAIYKVTNPLLIPIRKIIPGLFGIDLASIVLALLVQFFIAEVISLIIFNTFINPLSVLVWACIGTLKLASYIILVCILIMVISSFIAPQSQNPFIILSYQLMSPITTPLRKIIPPMGGLDFSVFFIGLGLVVVQKILDAFAKNSGLIPTLIIGY